MIALLLLLILQIAAMPFPPLKPSDFQLVESVPNLVSGTTSMTKAALPVVPRKLKPKMMEAEMDAMIKAANILTPALDLAGQLDPKSRAFLGMAKLLANTDPKIIKQVRKGAFAVLAGVDSAGAVKDFKPMELIKGGQVNMARLQKHAKTLGDVWMKDLKEAAPIHQARQVLNTITPLIPLLPAKSPPRVISQSLVLAANLMGLVTPQKVKIQGI